RFTGRSVLNYFDILNSPAAFSSNEIVKVRMLANSWIECRPKHAIHDLSHERRAGTFVVHFVGPLCRKWPETARFDKVFDKGSRQSGLNRWFWDRLYLFVIRANS